MSMIILQHAEGLGSSIDLEMNCTWQAVDGEYRWILYGEEDTVFFVDALQQLLKGYDWHMPYSLTGQPLHEHPLCLSETECGR